MKLKAHSRPKSWKRVKDSSSERGKTGTQENSPRTPSGGADAVFSPSSGSPDSHFDRPSRGYLPLLLAVLTVLSLPVIAQIASVASPKLLAPLLGFHVGPMRAASCIVSSKSMKASTNLPTLVFVAGVRGSGHTFFSTLFSLMKPSANITVEKLDPTVHVTADETQVTDPTAVARFKPCPKLRYSRQVYDVGAEVTTKLAGLQVNPGEPFRGIYVRPLDTFPLPSPMETPLNRPDLLALSIFHGIMYNLKVILLTRDPVQIMTERMGSSDYANDPGLLFRVIEDSLTYLDASVRQLPCGSYVSVNMDQLQSLPAASPEVSSIASSLVEFLGIPGMGEGDLLGYISQAKSLLANPVTGRRRLTEEEGSTSRGSRSRRRLPQAPTNSSGVEAGSASEEAQMWRTRFADKNFPRFLLWPLLSALADVPSFWPQQPGNWPNV